MADNGKIIRNGAEIQIDENGNVVARPAAGQELIVEDDARVGTLEAEDLRTDPTGTLAQLDGDQDIADDTQSEIEWRTETSRGQVSDLLDSTDNVVVIPDGYSFVKITIGVRFDDDIDLLNLRGQLNGGAVTGAPRLSSMGPEWTANSYNLSSAWIPVSENDEISADMRHQSGGTRTLEDREETYMEVWLI